MVIFQKRVAGVTKLALERFVSRARHEVRITGAVNVLVTSSTAMRSLNRRFRGKDKPTDVLSFSAVEDNLAKQSGARRPRAKLAGEIAISADIACKQARLLGHSPAKEVKILTLHGLLHLAGHDHERDAGQMAKREQSLRAKFGLPTGLIERASAAKKSSARGPKTSPPGKNAQ